MDYIRLVDFPCRYPGRGQNPRRSSSCHTGFFRGASPAPLLFSARTKQAEQAPFPNQQAASHVRAFRAPTTCGNIRPLAPPSTKLRCVVVADSSGIPDHRDTDKPEKQGFTALVPLTQRVNRGKKGRHMVLPCVPCAAASLWFNCFFRVYSSKAFGPPEARAALSASVARRLASSCRCRSYSAFSA